MAVERGSGLRAFPPPSDLGIRDPRPGPRHPAQVRESTDFRVWIGRSSARTMGERRHDKTRIVVLPNEIARKFRQDGRFFSKIPSHRQTAFALHIGPLKHSPYEIQAPPAGPWPILLAEHQTTKRIRSSGRSRSRRGWFPVRMKSSPAKGISRPPVCPQLEPSRRLRFRPAGQADGAASGLG